ncbi:MAG TPA: hypothetical protein VK843_16945 [Planctomycetota bacterium]|nr:hypothetical protein [Planctomycetota bacterium]
MAGEGSDSDAAGSGGIPVPRETPVARAPGRFIDRLLIALFLVAIVAPLVDGALRPSAERAMLAENRRPTPRPVLAFSSKSLKEYPGEFNRWYGDSFGLRDKLVRMHNVFKWYGFGVSPTSTLVLGKDDWVEFTWFNTIPVWRGIAGFEPAELESWRVLLEYRRDWLAKRGIGYIFALAPIKAEIYPERMPSRFDRVGPTRREQFFEYMSAHSDVEVIDFTTMLALERKNDGAGDDQVYYRLGVHWTDRGILTGYRELIRHLQKRFPEMQAWQRSDFELRPSPTKGDSWAWRLYMDDLLPQEPFDLVAIREKQAHQVPGTRTTDGNRRYDFVNQRTDLPVCMVLGDSFSEPMNEFLAENFSHEVGYRNVGFDAKTVAQDAPNVVIQLYNERVLVSHDPRNLLERAKTELGPIEPLEKR